MKAYPLHFPEKAPKGTKQGAKLPKVSKRGREISVFLAFSQYPSSIERIEQDLRRRPLYTAELLGHIFYVRYRDILLRIVVLVKKNRHIFHWEWNILSNSLFERSFKNAFPPYGAGRSG